MKMFKDFKDAKFNKKMTLIGICGKKGVGKDTVADYLVQRHEFHKDAFAAPLKKACSEIFGIPLVHFYDEKIKEEVDPFWEKSPRCLMQEVGTDLFRNHYDPTIWLRSMEKRLDEYEKVNKNICVCDVRFPNEALCLLQRGGTLVYIDRPSATTPYEEDQHSSETSVEYVRPMATIVLNNDGSIQDLLDQTEALLKCSLDTSPEEVTWCYPHFNDNNETYPIPKPYSIAKINDENDENENETQKEITG